MKFRPDEDVLLGLLPFYHIYGLVVVQFGALSQGARLITLPKFDPMTFLESIQKQKVSLSWLSFAYFSSNILAQLSRSFMAGHVDTHCVTIALLSSHQNSQTSLNFLAN